MDALLDTRGQRCADMKLISDICLVSCSALICHGPDLTRSFCLSYFDFLFCSMGQSCLYLQHRCALKHFTIQPPVFCADLRDTFLWNESCVWMEGFPLLQHPVVTLKDGAEPFRTILKPASNTQVLTVVSWHFDSSSMIRGGACLNRPPPPNNLSPFNNTSHVLTKGLTNEWLMIITS